MGEPLPGYKDSVYGQCHLADGVGGGGEDPRLEHPRSAHRQLQR